MNTELYRTHPYDQNDNIELNFPILVYKVDSHILYNKKLRRTNDAKHVQPLFTLKCGILVCHQFPGVETAEPLNH